MINKLTLTLLFTLSAFISLAQQDQIFFKEYGIREGLPEHFTLGFLEDDQGFIWIGTQNGLVKFDGYEMKSFGPNQQGGKSNTLLLRNLFMGVIKSRDGRLWLGSGEGLAIYDPEDQSFKNFLYHPDSTVLLFPFCKPILEDYHQNIWFTNYSDDIDTSVIGRYDQRTGSISYYPERIPSFRLNDLWINGKIAQSRVDSSLWILENKAPYHIKKFNSKADSFQTIFKPGDQVLDVVLPDTIRFLHQSEKYFLISKNGRVFLIDPVQEKVISYYDFKRDKSQGSNAFMDQKGFLWHRSGKYLSILNLKDKTRKEFEFGSTIPYPDPEEISWLLPQFITDEDFYIEINVKDNPSKYLRYHYDTESFHVYDQKFNVEQNPVVIKWDFFTRFHIDFSGTRWLGTRPNLFKEEIKRIKSIRRFGDERVAIDSLGELFEDSQGRVWVSYNGGILLRKHQDAPFQIFDADHGDFPFREVSNFLEDNKGQIWIKSQLLSNNGIVRYDETSGRFRHYLMGTQVGRLFFDQKRNHLWITNQEGIFAVNLDGQLLYQLAPSKTKGFNTRTIFQDSKGAIWFGDSGDNEHGIIRLEINDSTTVITRIPGDKNSLCDNEVHFVLEDKSKNIWIGTDDGLSKFSHGKFETIDMGSFSCYAIDQNDQLWFMTYSDKGLLHIDPESGMVVSYGMQQGLLHTDSKLSIWANNNQMSFDSDGRIYIPTERGLSVFDTRDKTFTNFTGDQGLSYTEEDYVTRTLSNGEVWFVSPDAIDIIDPQKLFAEKNSVPPKVWITSMTIMDSLYSAPDGEIFTKAVQFTDNIELSYWQKDLSFDFVALHYMRPQDNLYSWKLEGYDDEWTEPSRVRYASYTNLSPGTYTFRVKASNADGIWNEEGDFITIRIHPPIWLSNVAFILYGLLFIGLVLAAHRYQQKRTIQKERERQKDEKIAQAKKIEEAYQKLKSTQAQLVHSEKMASLGELTAGIAHEIQNPLNFVNNFSEVSMELADEMNMELDKGNTHEAKEIASDLKQNLEKITHHGKRADAIVKGMLAHSRNSSGEKTPTDINALADEYLRLSYHGLRAKDKSFNANFQTHFDPDLPVINVIPQDIGRVLLNLINNAFYAVNEKAKAGIKVYQPLVTVSTAKVAAHVDLKISDNGEGIPEQVRDKIFQPFFTTKPTGQGTGLGLSLSYDIVKAHSGELLCTSEPGEGTIFTIRLPIVS